MEPNVTFFSKIQPLIINNSILKIKDTHSKRGMLDTLRLHLKRAFIFLCNLNPAAYRQFTKFLILDHVTSHVTRHHCQIHHSSSFTIEGPTKVTNLTGTVVYRLDSPNFHTRPPIPSMEAQENAMPPTQDDDQMSEYDMDGSYFKSTVSTIP